MISDSDSREKWTSKDEALKRFGDDEEEPLQLDTNKLWIFITFDTYKKFIYLLSGGRTEIKCRQLDVLEDEQMDMNGEWMHLKLRKIKLMTLQREIRENFLRGEF